MTVLSEFERKAGLQILFSGSAPALRCKPLAERARIVRKLIDAGIMDGLGHITPEGAHVLTGVSLTE